MSIDAISFLAPSFAPPLAPMQAIVAEPTAFATASPSGDSFAAWMGRQVAATNTKLLDTDHQLQRLAAGETTNLHQVMLGLEDARLSFQLMVQVRNHLVEGYQDILRMSV